MADLPTEKLMTMWTDYELRELQQVEIINAKLESHAKASLMVNFDFNAEQVDNIIERRKNRTKRNVQSEMNSLGIDSDSLDVDTYIKRTLEDSKREEIKPESIKTTIFNSGYIDRKGKFYGCSDTHHRFFAERMEEQGMFDAEGEDPQKWLDSAGWIKLSMGRLYFFEGLSNKKPTKDQIDTILDYCEHRKKRFDDDLIMYNDKKYDFKQIFEVLEK